MENSREASLDLESYVDESVRRAVAAGYVPTIFMQMRDRHRTLGAMERIVKSGEIQSGFKRLNELGLAADWSVEASILKFASEFSRDAVECARWRLYHIDDA